MSELRGVTTLRLAIFNSSLPFTSPMPFSSTAPPGSSRSTFLELLRSRRKELGDGNLTVLTTPFRRRRCHPKSRDQDKAKPNPASSPLSYTFTLTCLTVPIHLSFPPHSPIVLPQQRVERPGPPRAVFSFQAATAPSRPPAQDSQRITFLPTFLYLFSSPGDDDKRSHCTLPFYFSSTSLSSVLYHVITLCDSRPKLSYYAEI